MKYFKLKKRLSILLVASMLMAQGSSVFAATTIEVNAGNLGSNAVNSEQYSEQYKDKSYTMMDLYHMDEQTLIETLSNITWNQVTDSFKFNEGALKFYGSERHLNAMINALIEKGQLYTADNNQGIPTIIELLRAGYYLGFYNKEMNFMKSDEKLNKLEPAVQSIISNPNFKLGTIEQEAVVSTLGLLINNSKLFDGVIEKVTPIVEDFANNYTDYINDRSKGKAIYDIIHSIHYSIENKVYRQRIEPKDSIYAGKIDKYIEALYRIPTEQKVREDEESFLIANTAYELSYLGKFHTNSKIGLEVLTKILDTAERNSELYLEAASNIKSDYAGKNIRGEKIDYDKMIQQVKQIYLPNKYEFDNGRIIITTGGNVTEEKVQRLYWAAKEVEAQFFRAYGRDAALEEGNNDDILDIVIYNSPKEYKMNRLINGISTDNGGMYLEGDGVFYTYERTPQESRYTLEELFRHEFTHFLQGRYVSPGQWGRTEIYKQDRLTWYEEGGAEFFAGATRTDGVLPRKSMVSSIKGYEDNWYSASKTLHSAYGSSFEFYTYAYTLTDLLYDDKAMFDRLAEVIKSGDTAKYDALIKELSNDQNLNQRYQQRMTELSDDYDELTVPLVSDDYIKSHEKESIETVSNKIQETFRLVDTKIKGSKSEYFNTFSLEGKYVGRRESNGLSNWEQMNKVLDESLEKLALESWSGYQTMTAYFKDLKVNAQGNIEATVVVRGILTDDINKVDQLTVLDYKEIKKPKQSNNAKDDVESIKLPDDIDRRFTDARGKLENNQLVNLQYNGSRAVYYFESNKTGVVTIDLKNLAKDINISVMEDNSSQDNCYMLSNAKDATLTFKGEQKRYYLALWGGETAENIQIRVNGIDDEVKQEEKPQDEQKKTDDKTTDIFDSRFTDAKSKIFNGNEMKFEYNGGRVVNYFDAVKNGKVSLNLDTNMTSLSCAVIKENENGYTAYADVVNGKNMDVEVTSGRYYVVVWSREGKSLGNVSLNATGDIEKFGTGNIEEGKKESEKEEVTISEGNDSFNEAKAIKSTATITDSLIGEDDSDYFTFEIAENQTKSINMDILNGSGANWLLYKAEDTSKYYAYALSDGNKRNNSVKLDAGKYYLVVYKYEQKDIDYNLKLN